MVLSEIFGSSEEVEELREKVKKLEEEREKFRKRFEAEKDRRSELSTEKQEAERQLKKLRQKLDEGDEEEEEQTRKADFTPLAFEDALDMIEKLSTVRSEHRDLVTVYSSNRISNIEDYRGLKNCLSSDLLGLVDRKTSLVGFMDENLFDVVMKIRPFARAEWSLSERFETDRLMDFISREKTWVVVSAGDSMVVREEDGEILEREEVASRVDHSHTQGGYSQKRFERKREEQVEEHIEQLKQKIGSDDPLVVGEKRLAEKIEGDYLGGFDDNRPLVDALYNFHLLDSQG